MVKSKRKPGQQPIEPGIETVVVPIRMTPAHRDKLKRLGGPAWVRKRIDRAREPKDE
jgi:hypothetical protein